MKPFVIAKNADMTTAIRVEYFSTGWMAFEFLIGFWSGFQAGSILLIAFGLDSFLEIISGATLIWRLKTERNGASASAVARAEQRSSLMVGCVLLLLSLYVIGVSGFNLVTHAAAESSVSGIGIAIASIIVMPFLTLRKRHLGHKLNSPALIEDGMCNITCAYMAATVLIGSLLTWLFNWWWADSVAALILVYFVASEGWEALQTGLSHSKNDE